MTRPTPTPAPGARRLPALDGLRGLAVLGVIAYHADRLRGGFLGVDLFFVLSGFLITALLLGEHARTGGVGLGAFWARRVRRLLPALLLVLAAVELLTILAPPADPGAVRADALGTLLYVANWRAIVTAHGYWAAYAEPSPLEHTWSLAIEEQFYVVWPLVVLVVLWVARRRWSGRGPRLLLALCVAGAAASLAAMVVGYRLHGDVDRLYLGTDTRVAAILVGAALAAWRASPRATTRPHAPGRTTALTAAGTAALAGIAVAWWWADGRSAALYQGGLFACSLAAVVVIAAVTRDETSLLARALSVPPLRAAGILSYGLYLWHWPIFTWLTPARTGLTGAALLALQLAVTLALAVGSYVLVERPVRRGALTGLRAPLATVTAVAVVLALLAVPPARTDADDAQARVASAIVPLGPFGSPVDRPDPPRVLVVGDSVGDSIASGLVAHEDAFGIQARSVARPGCGLTTGYPMIRRVDGTTDDESPCQDALARATTEVDAFAPDVVLVVLGWPGQTERLVDGAWRQPCDPVFDAWYESSLEGSLAAIARPGTRTFLTTAPYGRMPDSPPDTDRRTDCLNAIYRRLATGGADRPAVTAVDLAAWVCPSGSCRDADDDAGVPLRPDGLHFAGPTSVRAATWLLERVWELGRTTPS